MPWIISGNLKNSGFEHDGTTPIVLETSHLLRPNRQYNLGRGPFVTADGKTVKAKPRDFAISALYVPKEGAWTLKAGDWTKDDVLDNAPTSYSLTLTVGGKPMKIEREDGSSEEVQPNQSAELTSGDRVSVIKAVKLKFKVSWEPMNLCVFAVAPSRKQAAIDKAVLLGIKLGFESFKAEIHTHLIVKSVPTDATCLAAMARVPILTPNWLEDLWLLGKPLPFAEGAPSLDPAASTKDQFAFEDVLVKMDPEVGSDYRHFWGKCELEKLWSNAPLATDPTYFPSLVDATTAAIYPDWPPVGWSINPERSQLFANVLFISLANDLSIDTVTQQQIKFGSGEYLVVGVQESKTEQGILKVVDAKFPHGIPPETRVVCYVPRLIERTNPVYRALSPRFKITKFLAAGTLDIWRAIFKVDVSILLKTSPNEAPLEPSPTPSLGTSPPRPTSSAFSTFHRAHGTYPDEETAIPSPPGFRLPRMDSSLEPNQGGMEQGGSGTNEREPSPPPVVVKKLIRKHTGAHALRNQASHDPQTQLEPPNLSFDTYGSSYTNNILSSLPPSTGPVRKLKRRGDATPARGSLFDVLDPSSPPKKKPRHEETEEMGDDSTPLSNAVASTSGTQADALPIIQEDEEMNDLQAVAGPSNLKAQSRKRVASSVLESDDDDDDDDEDDASAAAPSTSKHKRVAVTKVGTNPPPPALTSTKVSAKTAPIAKKKVVGGKKGAAAEPAVDEGILQIKTTKRKGAERDQAFNDDFNALKIVRPTFKPLVIPKPVLIGWDDVDPAVEESRRLREQMEREDHPDNWGGDRKAGDYFIKVLVPMRGNQQGPPTIGPNGKPNYKMFKRKNTPNPHYVDGKYVRPTVPLFCKKPDDFGTGSSYKPKPKANWDTLTTKNNSAPNDGDDSMDDEPVRSTKASTSKGKAKPKPKQITLSSDSDGDFGEKGGKMDLDSDDDDASRASTSKGKGKAKASSPKPKAVVPAKRKAMVQTTLFREESDDSDSGRTFKGFGVPTQRRRK